MPERDAIAAQAIHWSARLHQGQLSASEQAALDAWRQADPAHETELQAQLTLQQAASNLSPALIQRLYAGEIPPRPNLARRKALRVGALVLLGGGVSGLLIKQTDQSIPDFQLQAETLKGERRQLALPDGSLLRLNTDTKVDVQFYARQRCATLVRGEAMFEFSRETTRPFEIACGALWLIGEGANINVKRQADAVQIAVQDGMAQVRSGPWWRRNDTHLAARQGLVVTRDGAQAAVHTANLSADLAWLDGRLVFRNTPLTQVVQELNRYLDTPLVLANDTVGRLHLSGAFSIDHPQGLLDALTHVLPITFTPQPNGAILVSHAPTDA